MNKTFMLINLSSYNVLPVMERWLLQTHAPETIARIGPWLTRYQSYRAAPPPPAMYADAEDFGYYNWRVTELWYRNGDPYPQHGILPQEFFPGYRNHIGLPSDRALRDKIILDIYGAPDITEIDGLGGANVLTSKTAIISRSSRADADIDYTFGQVMINEPLVDYGINCGNISAGVGPFAIDEGLVPAVEPVTKIRIFNTNTQKVITAEVPVKNGKAVVAGDYQIAGVPGTGAKITLDFAQTGGTLGKGLLPTGLAKEQLPVEGLGAFTVSIVDAANPCVFVKASDVGLTGQRPTRSAEPLPSNSECSKTWHPIWRSTRRCPSAYSFSLRLITSTTTQARWFRRRVTT